MGQCIPEAREPPTEKIRQCRMMLQALCGSLGVMGLLAILSGDFLSVINYLLYAYLLLMGWRTFNWCIMLMGFLLMSTQIVTVIIIFIGMYLCDYAGYNTTCSSSERTRCTASS